MVEALSHGVQLEAHEDSTNRINCQGTVTVIANRGAPPGNGRVARPAVARRSTGDSNFRRECAAESIGTLEAQ